VECVPAGGGWRSIWAAHNGVDILLDTFPFGGQHRTVCHGLWMGVPAVCFRGAGTCWQRLGASVLRQVGIEELVATDAGGIC